MTTSLERSVLAAHVLIDLLSAFEPGAPWDAVLQAGVPRLYETEAVRTASGDSANWRSEIGPFLTASLMAMAHLARELAIAQETDSASVIVALREAIDQVMEEERKE